jgi:hypothetical protein
VLTSLQALLRLAVLQRLGVFICALAVLLATTSSASALEPAQTKTRVWGFDFAEHNSAGLFRAASSGKHLGNRLARAEEASRSLLAARGGAEGASSKIAQVTEGQLNKFLVKPDHGSSFGLTGNWNPGRVGEISRVINQHINAEGTLAIQGTYRGATVNHLLNPSTGLNVVIDANGGFVSGWALSAEQQASVLFTGRLF